MDPGRRRQRSRIATVDETHAIVAERPRTARGARAKQRRAEQVRAERTRHRRGPSHPAGARDPAATRCATRWTGRPLRARISRQAVIGAVHPAERREVAGRDRARASCAVHAVAGRDAVERTGQEPVLKADLRVERREAEDERRHTEVRRSAPPRRRSPAADSAAHRDLPLRHRAHDPQGHHVQQRSAGCRRRSSSS